MALGLDLDRELLLKCRQHGLTVFQGRAEEMPIKAGSIDGLLCRVALPYTDEAPVLAEIGRVLKAGGVGRLCSVGAGYYARYFLLGQTWRLRFYGLRTLVNTWFYAASGRRLPGFWGDTTYQSIRRLGRYYDDNDLRLVKEEAAKTFWGFPVFIYHLIRKQGRDEAPPEDPR